MTKDYLIKYNEECEKNKKRWGDGPWMNEPNRDHWIERGFNCLIARYPTMGHFCGYVGVLEGHPLFGKDYHDDHYSDIKVHDGVTFTDFCTDPICRLSEESETDRVFWIGFDCGHVFDFLPMMNELRFFSRALISEVEYRTFEEVKKEVSYLAKQLSEM